MLEASRPTPGALQQAQEVSLHPRLLHAGALLAAPTRHRSLEPTHHLSLAQPGRQLSETEASQIGRKKPGGFSRNHTSLLKLASRAW